MRYIVVDALRELHDKYDTRMNELAKKKPEAAGFWDGFVAAYLGTPCERKKRSKIYSQHVKYGMAVGFGTSLAALPFGVAGKIMGLLPYSSRGAKYLHEKVGEAKEAVAKKYSGGGPP